MSPQKRADLFAIALALVTFAWLGWVVGTALAAPMPHASCDAEQEYAVFLDDPEALGWETPFTCIVQDRVVLP